MEMHILALEAGKKDTKEEENDFNENIKTLPAIEAKYC